MKFGRTKGTGGLLKLTKFDVATLIFGDTRHPTISCDATEILQVQAVTVLRLRHFSAKKRPAGDALASSECICVSIWLLACCIAPLARYVYSTSRLQQ